MRPVLLPRARLLGVASVSLAMLAPALPAVAASSSAHSPGPAAHARAAASSAANGGSAITIRRDERGHAHYIGAAAGRVLARSASPALSPAAAARENLGRYAADFGISSPSRDLRTASVQDLAKGQSVVRFQQTAKGLPVFGGQLTSVLDSANNLLSVTGETSAEVRTSTYSVTAGSARAAALGVTGADHGLAAGALRATAPQQWLYDPSLFDSTASAGARAVWRVEVTARDYLDVRELVLVDAGTGRVLLHKDEIEHADRVVCDNGGHPNDVYRCDRAHYKRTEGSVDSGVADVDAAYLNAGAASNFYGALGVDLTALIGSDFGDGKKIRSTVRVCPTVGACPYDNAFWDGSQMVYGRGFAKADDVVAHELSHGVTQHTSGLVYWNQSGAINESMSDVFGELVDLSDGIGNDDPLLRWQLGEDLPASPDDLGRDLKDPPAHRQPDMVDGPYWTDAGSDSGGVHTNSGVGNKAAYLITDGTSGEPDRTASGGSPTGTFNGQTIPVGLGIAKTAQIYWRTEQLLTPGSDYGDLAYALLAACSSLAAGGIAGIVADDCTNVVGPATVATQMQFFPGPSVPQNVRILGGYHEIRVLWSAPASSGAAPVSSYLLVVKPAIEGEDFLPIDDPRARDVTIGGIPAGRTFTFGLMAVSPEGNSPTVSLILQGTRLSLSTKKRVVFNKHAKLTGRLTFSNGVGVGGRHVTLYRKIAGHHGYHAVSTKTTTSHGAYKFRPRQKHKATYFVSFASKVSGLLGSRSSKHKVAVRRR